MSSSIQAANHNLNTRQPLPYDLFWADMAEDEITHLTLALGEFLQSAHHIGSTAIPHISSIPVIDLLLVIKNEDDLKNASRLVEISGYNPASNRAGHNKAAATFTKPDPETDETLFQLHCYLEGAEAIKTHLALTKYLTNNPDQAKAYEQIKSKCSATYPENDNAYQQCKTAAMQDILSAALASV